MALSPPRPVLVLAITPHGAFLGLRKTQKTLLKKKRLSLIAVRQCVDQRTAKHFL
jgi:hypothetical protein